MDLKILWTCNTVDRVRHHLQRDRMLLFQTNHYRIYEAVMKEQIKQCQMIRYDKAALPALVNCKETSRAGLPAKGIRDSWRVVFASNSSVQVGLSVIIQNVRIITGTGEAVTKQVLSHALLRLTNIVLNIVQGMWFGTRTFIRCRDMPFISGIYLF